MTYILTLIPTPIEVDFLAVRDAFDAAVLIADARIGAWDASGVHHAVEIDATDAVRFEILVEKDDDGNWFVGSVTIEGGVGGDGEDGGDEPLTEADERMCVFIARVLCGEEGYDAASLALRGAPPVAGNAG